MIASALPHRPLSRREVGLWIGCVLFGRFLLEFADPVHIAYGAGGRNFFRLFALIVMLPLLASGAELGLARAADIGAFAACALCAFLPGYNAIWIATTLMAAYFWLSRDGDPSRGSAAVILVALSVSGIWGRLFFSVFGAWLLDLDAWFVAKVLQATGALTFFQDNRVVAGRSDLEIYAPCSSFQNISTALLIWLSLTKFVRPYWVRSDAAFAVGCVAVTLVWNTTRLFILAMTESDAPVFDFWHAGLGAHIFIAGLGFVIAMVAVAGATRAAA